ncbi:MAG TPA: hypothetical protein VEA37_08235, partial [Flavobacterium sp.]|nr:hypothetical protein [Flavobacterium sp.]
MDQRQIDKEVDISYRTMKSRFALVSKARANVWATSAVTLFIIGFIVGIVFVADPQALTGLRYRTSDAKLIAARHEVYVTAKQFTQGTPVKFGVKNNTKQVLKLPNSAPWEIRNIRGEVI